MFYVSWDEEDGCTTSTKLQAFFDPVAEFPPQEGMGGVVVQV